MRFRLSNEWIVRGLPCDTQAQVRKQINNAVDYLFTPGSCEVKRITYLTR